MSEWGVERQARCPCKAALASRREPVHSRIIAHSGKSGRCRTLDFIRRGECRHRVDCGRFHRRMRVARTGHEEAFPARRCNARAILPSDQSAAPIEPHPFGVNPRARRQVCVDRSLAMLAQTPPRFFHWWSRLLLVCLWSDPSSSGHLHGFKPGEYKGLD